MTVDVHPAAQRMADLVRGVRDDQLGAETPCPDYSLGDLLDHVAGLSLAFTAAARKVTLPEEARTPRADAARLGGDWRQRIPAALDELAEAWDAPEAWTGMTQAGPVELPGDVAGLVAINELVLHGWDVAKASGQDYHVDEESVQASSQFVAQFSGPGTEADRGDAFGPEVAVSAEAPPLDRLLGMSGRDPAWAHGAG
jgi:uncharacterized protein (TIGR03086 family)